MGLFWDLMQQSQLSSQRNRTESLDGRLTGLEDQVDALEARFLQLVKLLEENVGRDLDGDGRVG
jgi:acyl carrier protein phosphodiesterase